MSRNNNKHIYDPSAEDKKKVAFEILAQVRSQGLMQPYTGPIELRITALYKPPARCSKKDAELLVDAPRVISPDIDNIAKFYLDAMNSLVYQDDRQVCKIHAEKKYGRRNSVVIEIVELETQKLTVAQELKKVQEERQTANKPEGSSS